MRSCCPAVRSGGAAPMRRTWSQLCSARRWQQCRGVLSVVSDQTQERIILGIESSCDDTGVAVVTSSGRVLGEAIASQADIHAPWGGVVPNLAMEAHKAAIHKTVDDALRQAGLKPSDLDAVAVTVGPGLSLCLRVGVLKARQLSFDHQLPVVPVHHMEAHALVARLGKQAELPFPFLCLLVSGGHNLLVLVRGVGDYVQLGSTLDDALGEAYDKVARMLALELKPHGGAALEALARTGDPQAFKFALPMKKYANCDFSYAGLKTSVRLAIEANLPDPADPTCLQTKADIAASFQAVAVKHLRMRTARAVEWAKEMEPGLKHIVVAGGVASNQYVRAQLTEVAEEGGLELVLPPPRWCIDNGVMVAWAGAERLAQGWVQPPAESGEPAEGEWVDLRPRWPLTTERHPRSLDASRSAKKERIHTSLTELTKRGLGSLQQPELLSGQHPAAATPAAAGGATGQ